MDFGHKQKNFKGNLKRSILPRGNMTVEQVLAKMPDLGSFAPQDLEVYVKGWFTPNAKEKVLKYCASRSNHKCPRTSGSKRYPRVVTHEMKRDTRITPMRKNIFLITDTKTDGTPVSTEAGEKMDMMQTAKSSTQASSEESTLRSIAWSNDDPYAQTMGRPEYPRRVSGVGFGVLPTRSTSCSLTTPITQDPALAKEVSVLRAQLAAQKAAHEARVQEYHARFAAQEARLAQMQTLIESLMPNPGTGNPFQLHSSQEAIGSRPGEHRTISGDEHNDQDIAANGRTS